MTAIVGFITVLLVLVLILTKKSSPLVALFAIPTIACFIVGQGASYSEFVVTGIKALGPTVAMFCFAITFFNMMIDLGTFDPVVNAALRFAKSDPIKIMIATVIISIIGHLDGAGSTTFILTIGAMTPIFDRLKLNKMYMIILCGLSAGIMNIVPWGGPTLRVMSVFETGVEEVFNPLVIPLVVGLICVFGVAVYYGKLEKKRVGNMVLEEAAHQVEDRKLPTGLLVFNWVLILVAMFCMIKGVLNSTVCMGLAMVIAFVVNKPKKKDQDIILNKVGTSMFSMMLVLFATGCFTGILNGSGMLTAMAETIAANIPTKLGHLLPLAVGVVAFPMSFLFTPDAYYYSILPTLSAVSEGFGVSGLAVGRASLMGQMTVGFPFSGLNATSYMLTEMTGLDFGDFQKKGIPVAYLVSLIMVVTGVLCGCIPL